MPARSLLAIRSRGTAGRRGPGNGRAALAGAVEAVSSVRILGTPRTGVLLDQGPIGRQAALPGESRGMEGPMSERSVHGSLAALALAAAVASPSAAQDAGNPERSALGKAKPPYSPYAGRNFPTRPYFGDTHLHTA